MASPNLKPHLDIQQLILVVKFHDRQFTLQARDIESKTDYRANGDNDGASVDFLKEVLKKIADSYPNDPFPLCIRNGSDIVRDAACAAIVDTSRPSILDGAAADGKPLQHLPAPTGAGRSGQSAVKAAAKKAAPEKATPRKAAPKKALPREPQPRKPQPESRSQESRSQESGSQGEDTQKNSGQTRRPPKSPPRSQARSPLRPTQRSVRSPRMRSSTSRLTSPTRPA